MCKLQRATEAAKRFACSKRQQIELEFANVSSLGNLTQNQTLLDAVDGSAEYQVFLQWVPLLICFILTLERKSLLIDGFENELKGFGSQFKYAYKRRDFFVVRLS